MRTFFVIRSISGGARDYASRHLRAAAWFDDADAALTELADMDRDDRPPSVAVPLAFGSDTGQGVASRAMAMGYIVQSRSVP